MHTLLAGLLLFAFTDKPSVSWQDDYTTAYKLALKEGKDLVIVFRHDSMLDSVLSASEVQAQLGKYVCLRLPMDFEYEGKRLIDHNSMRVFQGKDGIAVLSLKDKTSPWYREIIASRTIRQQGSSIVLPGPSEVTEMLERKTGNTVSNSPASTTPTYRSYSPPAYLPSDCRH